MSKTFQFTTAQGVSFDLTPTDVLAMREWLIDCDMSVERVDRMNDAEIAREVDKQNVGGLTLWMRYFAAEGG